MTGSALRTVVPPVRARGSARDPALGRTVWPEATRDSSWLTRSGGHEETAQVVVRRSISLATGAPVAQIGGIAVELLRVANNDPATLDHALVVCRSLARHNPADERLQLAIRLLERVTVFLGGSRPAG
jgi:hypothetical protein